jgi:MYXO-CTERM domain-containing protein
MRIRTGVLTLTGLTLAGLPGYAKDLPSFDANASAASATPTTAARANAGAFTFVASEDPTTGAPKFVWAVKSPSANLVRYASAELAAKSYARTFADAYGVPAALVDSATVSIAHAIPGGGSVVTLVQREGDIEIWRSKMSVFLDANNDLVAISGGLHPAGSPDYLRSQSFSLPAEEVLQRALGDLYSVTASVGLTYLGKDVAGYEKFGLASPGTQGFRFLDPARVKKIFFPIGGKLVPAYYTEVIGRTVLKGNDAYAYVFAASDGRLLYRENLTAYEAFKYRVWADPAAGNVPTDGPRADYTPHPTGNSTDTSKPAYAMPVLVETDSFKKLPAGALDPWLAATATESNGNNVDAYSDRDNRELPDGGIVNDGYNTGDYRATTTAARTFDRTYNTAQAPNASTDQIRASVTQLFYTNNWLHDYWYDSGFNEAAGVAQKSNFGRGGVENDAMKVEAQDSADSGQSDNANMSTPADGAPPRMQMYVWTGTPQRDGTIDNTIVAHEWGHYFHHRLVKCGGTMCGAMSEGWGDWIALHMVIKENDNWDATYALAQYATDTFYRGIRRQPYSVTKAKDGLTFKHVMTGQAVPAGTTAGGDNAEVHNAGEVWATMMHEGYIALLKETKKTPARYTFAEARRRMADYVVAGMLGTPVEPTFIEQRDAILAAAAAADRADMLVLATAYAVRGFGTGAKSPASTSTNNAGVVESFVVKGDLGFVSAAIDDSVKSCDNDGNLDATESGKVTIELRNSGVLPLSKTTATVKTATAGVTFGNGGVVQVPALEGLASTKVTVDVQLDASFMDASTLPLTVTLADPDAVTTTFDTALKPRFNHDEIPQSSTTDDVEAKNTPWKIIQGPTKVPVWARESPTPRDDTSHFWHGIDVGTQADESLESPDLVVAATGSFVVDLTHKFKFETGPVPPAATPVYYWDGALIEVSQDGGATWADVSTLATPGYNGTIGTYPESDNPLKGRPGFVNQSTGYPNTTALKLDFGTKLAGKTVRLRFRIATDSGAGDFGWQIDDIKVTGITNKPFPTVVKDATDCAGLPAASAGADQTVLSGQLVTLDASASTDPTNDPLTFAWAQLAGPMVTLNAGTTNKPSFTAPQVTARTTLTFRVTVSDGKGSAGDTVDVFVDPGDGGIIVVDGGPDGSTGTGGAGGSMPDASVDTGTGTGGTGGSTGGAAGTGGSTSDAGRTDSSSPDGGVADSGSLDGTSADGAGGAAGRGGSGGSGGSTTGGNPPADDGCSCRAAGHRSNGAGWIVGLMAATLTLVRRRRRHA